MKENINYSISSKVIFYTSLFLSLFGILMVYSSTFNINFVIKQVLAFLIGIFIYFFITLNKKLTVDLIKQSVPLLVLVNIILLILVFTPLGVEVNGARGWINLGFITFQPSELSKIVIILYTAYFIENKVDILKDFKKGFVAPFIIMLVLAFLIEIEPDLGNATIVAFLFLVTMFVGGTPLWHFIPLITFSFIAFILLVLTKSYRIKRFLAFIDPFKDPLGYGYNIIQSLIAHAKGGILGVGFGNSLQKQYYLPEKHTDFIYSIIGEEFGLIGTLTILILFFILFSVGIHNALNQKNTFRKLVLFSLSFMIFFQAAVNISVTLSLLPATGITLPFISYGGTSMIINWLTIAIINKIINEPLNTQNLNLKTKIISNL
ncbi:MAG: putative lipid II flippase FtsW [bacterium]|nr:putative lipid II flippase FtsW [bacterium]